MMITVRRKIECRDCNGDGGFVVGGRGGNDPALRIRRCWNCKGAGQEELQRTMEDDPKDPTCPFCGAEPLIVSHDHRECPECKAVVTFDKAVSDFDWTRFLVEGRQ